MGLVGSETSQITESGHFLREAVTSCLRRVAGYYPTRLDERSSIMLRNRQCGVGGGVAGVFGGRPGPTWYRIKLVYVPWNWRRWQVYCVARVPDPGNRGPFGKRSSYNPEVTGSDPARDVVCLANLFLRLFCPREGNGPLHCKMRPIEAVARRYAPLCDARPAPAD